MAYVVCTTSADEVWTKRNAGIREVHITIVDSERDAQRLCNRLNLPAANDGYHRTYPFYYRAESIAEDAA